MSTISCFSAPDTVVFLLIRSTISDTSAQLKAVAIRNSIEMNDVRSVSAYLRPFWDERIGMLSYPNYLCNKNVLLVTFLIISQTILHYRVQPFLSYKVVRFPFQIPLQRF